LFLVAGTAARWIASSDFLRSGLLNLHKSPQEIFGKDVLTVLILGCDEDRAPGGKKIERSGVRSDMMLLARLDFVNKKITGVSIPRDTMCKVDGYKNQKINAYHAMGGKDLAQKAVETLLDVKIDRTVDLDFQAFQDMVDMTGGVPIHVDKNLNYDDNAGHLHIHIKKGDHVLNGYDSMGFVRFRHSDSDFARQERQHQFMLAFRRVLQKRWGSLGQIADQSLKVAGDEFTAAEASKLAQFSMAVKEKDIKFGAVPAIDGPKSTLLLDEDKVDATLQEFGFRPSPQAATTTQ
jgi:LCP family protein required for cell wall assembly